MGISIGGVIYGLNPNEVCQLARIVGSKNSYVPGGVGVNPQQVYKQEMAAFKKQILNKYNKLEKTTRE